MRWSRRVHPIVLAAVVAFGILTFPGAALAATGNVTFVGAGWGHGVGMSQYGAYGMAAEGRSWTEILAHFYTGTAVAQAATTGDIRVNVAQSSEVAVTPQAIAGGGGIAAFSVPWGVVSMSPGQTWRFRPGGGGAVTIVPPTGSPVSTPSALAITWDPAVTVIANAATGTRYRWGNMWVTSPPGAQTQVAAVNQLPLDPLYLYGIAEVPTSFPADAQLAQATAARSFALRKARAGIRSACDCHVYGDTRDQNFTGWEKLAAGADSWKSAVDLTTGWVVTYAGALAEVYYFSSTGGRTENNEDVWGGTPLPYLRSVDDHWSLNPPNPHRSWTKEVAADQAAATVGLDVLWAVDVSDRTAGGTVRTARFLGLAGGVPAQVSLSGTDMKTRFGLLGARVQAVVVPGSPLAPDRVAECTSRPDFTGDGLPELTVFHPATAGWSVAGVRSGTLGSAWSTPCAGDYTGDGIADFAAFDPTSGTWTIEGATPVAYGAPGDQPVPHNYDCDPGGAYEMAVFRPSTGRWFVRFMSDAGVPYGGPGDVATPTDFDGDRCADLTVFRPAGGMWFVRSIADAGVPFGAPGDVAVPADFTGDGRSEIAVYRPSNGVWYVAGLAPGGISFGAPGDIPVLADYDGDRIADLAVFRPSNATWYVRRIAPGGVPFGAVGDVPVMRWR